MLIGVLLVFGIIATGFTPKQLRARGSYANRQGDSDEVQGLVNPAIRGSDSQLDTRQVLATLLWKTASDVVQFRTDEIGRVGRANRVVAMQAVPDENVRRTVRSTDNRRLGHRQFARPWEYDVYRPMRPEPSLNRPWEDAPMTARRPENNLARPPARPNPKYENWRNGIRPINGYNKLMHNMIGRTEEYGVDEGEKIFWWNNMSAVPRPYGTSLVFVWLPKPDMEPLGNYLHNDLYVDERGFYRDFNYLGKEFDYKAIDADIRLGRDRLPMMMNSYDHPIEYETTMSWLGRIGMLNTTPIPEFQSVLVEEEFDLGDFGLEEEVSDEVDIADNFS
mmetsp:Transcript_116142/g.183546  ORF Transcript_116142/g.183546 Transcript_116142/m.183546 type:complete len:334 (+) Transcript_116142:46-1047(+)